MDDKVDAQTLVEMTRLLSITRYWKYYSDCLVVMFYVLSIFLRRSELYDHQGYYNLASVNKLDFGATLNNTKMLDGRQNFFFNEDDITATEDITDFLRRHHIDSIIHLATQSNIDVGLGNPASFPSTNLVGTQALLECFKDTVSGKS